MDRWTNKQTFIIHQFTVRVVGCFDWLKQFNLHVDSNVSFTSLDTTFVHSTVLCIGRLKTETKWSIGYYSYFFACKTALTILLLLFTHQCNISMYVVCLAAGGDVTAANAELQNIPSIVKNKNSNYEKLVLRRVSTRHIHSKNMI